MPQTQRRRKLHVLVVTLYALIVFVAVIIALIPTISQYAYRHWLEQQHLQGDIEHVRLAFNTGTLTLLNAKISDGEHTLLSLGKLQLRIRLRDLFSHKLTIERVELANTRIRIKQTVDMLAIAGIRIKPSESDASPATSPPAPGAKPWMISLQSLQISNLDTCLVTATTSHPQNLCSHLGRFVWQGHAGLSTREPLNLNAMGQITTGDLALQDQANNRQLAQLASLTISGIAVDSLDRIKIDKLEMRKLKMLPATDTSHGKLQALGLDKLQIDSVNLDKLAFLDIAAVSIENLSSHVRLNADNSVAPIDELAGLRAAVQGSPSDKNKTSAAPESRKSFRVKLGKLNVSTTRSLVLEDTHTKPAVTHSIDNFSFNLGAIDSSRPKQASPLSMQFKYGRYGQVKVNGAVRVFAAKPTLDLKASILGVNLNRVSPYLRKLLQHKVKSGQLDAKLAIKIVQGRLDSDAKLTLYKFYVENLAGKQSDKYQKSLGIPLASALSLLRDRSDAIRLDLPVTGDVEHPDFSLNDIISTVSMKAIKVAVINYYASLGLVSLLSGAYDLMTALRFDPVVFAPGQSVLSDASLAQLDKFATMLHERPQVHLVVCGHAGVADRIKLFPAKKPSTENTAQPSDKKSPPLTGPQVQQLNKLARARGDAIKLYLVKQKKVAADRLILCSPEFVAGDEHSPYAELHI